MNALNRAAVVLLLLFAATLVARASGPDQCVTCHEGLGDKVSSLFRTDVHRA